MAADMHCTFCGKGRDEVHKLVSSPDPRVFICDECARSCYVLSAPSETAEGQLAAAHEKTIEAVDSLDVARQALITAAVQINGALCAQAKDAGETPAGPAAAKPE